MGASKKPQTVGAHPRAGGENRGQIRVTWKTTGSSPRGRGKPAGGASGLGARGLIPARAGKTTWKTTNSHDRQAHPRAGGENFRARRWRFLLTRLIPARAGKTIRRGPRGAPAPTHPRAGGENKFGGLGVDGRLGSSPRGRGKRASRTALTLGTRLIPARAGKTPPCNP